MYLYRLIKHNIYLYLLTNPNNLIFYSIELLLNNTLMRFLLRSKIHKAIVTEANLEYIGSITIDSSLLKKVNLWPGEKVLVVSNTSGARLETYVIEGKADSGVICMNGAAAHHIKTGEEIIIMGFELTDKKIQANVILVNNKNVFEKYF